MRRILWTSLAALLVLAGPALAQTGTVVGTVVDADEFPVEAARVSLHMGDECIVNVLTNTDGEYILEDVEAGMYTLKAGKPRVGSATVEDVVVVEDETTEVPTIILAGSGPHGPHGRKGSKFQQG